MEHEWEKAQPGKVPMGTVGPAGWNCSARESTAEQDAGSTALAACVQAMHTKWERKAHQPPPCPAELQPQEEDRRLGGRPP